MPTETTTDKKCSLHLKTSNQTKKKKKPNKKAKEDEDCDAGETKTAGQKTWTMPLETCALGDAPTTIYQGFHLYIPAHI